MRTYCSKSKENLEEFAKQREMLNDVYSCAKTQARNNSTLEAKLLLSDINTAEQEIEEHKKNINNQLENILIGTDSQQYYEKKFN